MAQELTYRLGWVPQRLEKRGGGQEVEREKAWDLAERCVASHLV